MKPNRLFFAFTFAAMLLAGCASGPLNETDAPTTAEGTPATAHATATGYPGNPMVEQSPSPSPSQTAGTAQTGETVMYVSLEHFGSTLTVRAEPSAKAKAAGTLHHRAEVTVLAISGGWAKILHDGQKRYVKADYLVKHRPPALEQPKATTGKSKTTAHLKAPAIKVYKSRRILELWDGKKRIDTFPMALGWEPSGHKQQEGDGKTPEGEYYVCTRNAASSYYKSMGVSYPGKSDAEKAFDSGLITVGERDSIKDAIASRQCPPWNTPLGGAIMIHGGGSENDWTAGCIAVEDAVMDILWECCEMGTRISIYP